MSVSWKNPARFLLVLASVLALPGVAFGFDVTIDPGQYQGRYFLSGVGELAGVNTVSVTTGVIYSIDNGSSVDGSSFTFSVSFTVDGSGNVVSDNSVAAVGVGSTLKLNNALVTIDPVAYTGRYFIQSHFPQAFYGLQQLVLIPGLVYTIDDGTNVAGSTFSFYVGPGGLVTNASAASAEGDNTTLRFKNTTITVDPASYTGKYLLSAYWPTSYYGKRDFVMVPGLVYAVDDGSAIQGSAFQFVVAADGSVSVPTGVTSATGSGSTLTFTTVSVTFDPGAYSGTYTISSYTGTFSGTTTLDLVPGTYTMAVGAQVLTFQVNADGSVAILGAGSDVATGGSGQLTFGSALGGGVKFPGTLDVELLSAASFTASSRFDGKAVVSGVDAAAEPQASVFGISFNRQPAQYAIKGHREGKDEAAARPDGGIGVSSTSFASLFHDLAGVVPSATASSWDVSDRGAPVVYGGPYLVTGRLRVTGRHSLGDPMHPVVVVIRPAGPELPKTELLHVSGEGQIHGVVFIDLSSCTQNGVVVAKDLVKIEGRGQVNGVVAIDGPSGTLDFGKGHDRAVWGVEGHGRLTGAAVVRLHGSLAGGSLPVVEASGDARLQYDSEAVKHALAALSALKAGAR